MLSVISYLVMVACEIERMQSGMHQILDKILTVELKLHNR